MGLQFGNNFADTFVWILDTFGDNFNDNFGDNLKDFSFFIFTYHFRNMALPSAVFGFLLLLSGSVCVHSFNLIDSLTIKALMRGRHQQQMREGRRWSEFAKVNKTHQAHWRYGRRSWNFLCDTFFVSACPLYLSFAYNWPNTKY